MLTIVCGEDTISSRKHFQNLKAEYKSKGFEIKILPDVRLETIREQLTETSSLFTSQRVFFSENLVKQLKLKRNKASLEELDKIIKIKDIAWYDWETYTAREITNPKSAQIKEFKASTSIFKLLDECYPGNLKQFLGDMTQVLQSEEDGFIYAMLCKHIRTLILAKSNSLPPSTPPSQRGKLKSQAALWTLDKLISFYDGLARIDISVKTSANPYGIKKSLDIMACYLL